ncbi:hypothetical protein GCM10009126_25340 [Rhodanobacter caeni]|uniref:SDR family NAD(P)-dependent oxidoreductase n=1 Tax=Rhodanobacter caeni TaxID=657654 RepID=A0ABN0URJ9_9GAMM
MSNNPDLSKELGGRRALITGGTRGIGAVVAQRLLDAGARVVIAARKPDDAMPAGQPSSPATSPRAKAWR